MKTIIEVESFGNFDMKYTDSIFVSDEVYNISELKSEFCTSIGIESLNTLPDNMVTDTIEFFKKFLIRRGFKQLETNKIIICS